MQRGTSLVSTEWLAEHINAPDVRVVDGSWYLPNEERDPHAEYAERHIHGAVFFDIDEISNEKSALPHMLPSPEKFSSRARKLGLGDGVRIVIYDGGNMMAAARVWWMFRAFGHEDVAVLDGGLAKWTAEERPVDDEAVIPRERHLTARMNTFLVRDWRQMLANIESGREQVVDARGVGRFTAEEPEIRPGIRGGHIPGSSNLPYSSLLNADATIKDDDALKAAFASIGVDTGKSIATTCGSGISACFLALALDLIGARKVAVYDGSWTEWGGRDDTPVATGV
ncbi:MAG: 3-mercaptopyruvate sulfurtransferase [Rhodospirillaceae bacterium]|jgi:thiosulfate/3-mercaptopyruvate sulfurtransferase|nr:3-mercaptopyruvate sulfurtransferase [Rhodospirillaceae bacterium]MBT6511369.1 3-mercaptopyruvate sulfurtransferase [Rhodospirillaceae bacterium]